MFIIEERLLRTVNNDPQRRCYNGCHASTEDVWTPWETLESFDSEEKATKRIKFWEELNAYAVSQRGKENTLREFRVKEKSCGRSHG